MIVSKSAGSSHDRQCYGSTTLFTFMPLLHYITPGEYITPLLSKTYDLTTNSNGTAISIPFKEVRTGIVHGDKVIRNKDTCFVSP